VPLDSPVVDRRRLGRPDLCPAVQSASMKLCGARVALDAHSAVPADIEIEQGRIGRTFPHAGRRRQVSSPNPVIPKVDLSGYLLLPGLVNAHDHLEFSLFPKLGCGPYPNAERWAKDIYHPDCSPIREHLDVPKPVRLWWGGIRNLLGGVTTVCHHNEFQPEVFNNGFPVRVVERYAWSHSLRFGQRLEAAFRSSSSEIPYVIHLSEGTDAASAAEIFELDRRGLLSSRTVIVHGVGLDDAGHELVIRRGAALIWCPGSNLFTLGSTLSPHRIEGNPRTALGSDSALTAGDLLDQIRIAQELGVSPEHIFGLVTRCAADVLKLGKGDACLHNGSRADMVAVPDRGLSPAATLVQLTMCQVELVLLAGAPRLLSHQMLSRFCPGSEVGFDIIVVDGLERYVRADVKHLLKEAQKQLGRDVKLSGKHVGQ
jgi:cytosine/adenosine deaminase-related metal-dependent hydrolase